MLMPIPMPMPMPIPIPNLCHSLFAIRQTFFHTPFPFPFPFPPFLQPLAPSRPGPRTTCASCECLFRSPHSRLTPRSNTCRVLTCSHGERTTSQSPIPPNCDNTLNTCTCPCTSSLAPSAQPRYSLPLPLSLPKIRINSRHFWPPPSGTAPTPSFL